MRRRFQSAGFSEVGAKLQRIRQRRLRLETREGRGPAITGGVARGAVRSGLIGSQRIRRPGALEAGVQRSAVQRVRQAPPVQNPSVPKAASSCLTVRREGARARLARRATRQRVVGAALRAAAHARW
ncbi:MAG: hypothetical protein AMXMBFR34_31510 [Myxococcaceae bacterium]